MTIYEKLFGTPEKAAKTLECCFMSDIGFCYMLDALSEDQDVKCKHCFYECNNCDIKRKGITFLNWLNQEVTE